MILDSSPARIPPSKENVDLIDSLLKKGLYLAAWKEAEELSPLKTWEGSKGRTVAARLTGHLGDDRTSDFLHLVNFRKHADNDDAFFWAIHRIKRRRGPYRALVSLTERIDNSKEMKDSVRADLLAFKSRILGGFRDFELAHEAIEMALKLKRESSWLHTQRSALLELEDRYEEALEEAKVAVGFCQGTPSARLRLAGAYINCLDEDSALACLIPAHEKSESSAFAARLVTLYSERDDHERALFYLKAYEDRSPLIDNEGKAWVIRRRSDFLYLSGNFQGCLEHCDRIKADCYHKRIAIEMRRPGALERKRVRLDVPFIRQHRTTCAPSTMAAIAAYWGYDFDHLEIAQAICYEGTSWIKERIWAEANGFIAEEFRLTREVLVALIDREIPFALTTEAVTSAHLQACIGYDDRQSVAILRDPTESHYGEILLSGLIDDHPVQGPRAMLLLPLSEQHRLDGINLPDQSAYTGFHDLECSLEKHDRKAALVALSGMPEDHPLTWKAKLRLADYDQNPPLEFEAINSLAKRFPKNESLLYSRLTTLRSHHNPELRNKLLYESLKQESVDPVFYSEMGEFLLSDGRKIDLASHYLEKAVRQRPLTGRVYSSLASCRRKQREFREAARLQRIASCLEASWEPYASTYCDISKVIGEPEKGVQYLRTRVRKLGDLNAGPWITLAQTLNTNRETSEAKKVLESGMDKRPDDGELKLAAGDMFAKWGEPERGESLIQSARPHVKESEWLNKAAVLAEFLGKRQAAISYLKALLPLDPYNVAPYRSLARLLSREKGVTAAIGFLKEATSKLSSIPGIWILLAEWEKDENPGNSIKAIEKAIQLDENYCWCWRELALQRKKLNDEDGACEAAREALERDPSSPTSFGILGSVYEAFDRKDEAVDAYLHSLKLDIDYVFAAERLMDMAADVESSIKYLEYIYAEIQLQVSSGAIIHTYRNIAYAHIEPDVLISQLREFCDARPDLWQTWSGRLEQALDMGRIDEAVECGTALKERFPLLPRAWADFSSVCKTRSDFSGEIIALERALDLSPGWTWAARRLSTALERDDRADEAGGIIERALHYDPLEGSNYGFLAELLWRTGKREEAFERLKNGVGMCPDYHWGWSQLVTWSKALSRENEVSAELKKACERRGHNADWWSQYADHLNDLGRSEEALEVIDTGLELHAGNEDLFESKGQILSELERHDEALQACREGLEASPGCRYLLGRESWVYMQSGQPKEAMSRMKKLIGDHPDYLWAIRILLEWLNARRNWEEVVDYAQRWIRQEPNASIAYGYLFNAARAMDNRSDAKDAIAKAYLLDPEYEFAGRNLLSYHIEDREFEEAEKTLRTLSHFGDSAGVAADAVELAVALKKKDTALEHAMSFLRHEGCNNELAEWVGEIFTKAGWKRHWYKLLDETVADTAQLKASLLEVWIHSLEPRFKLEKGAAFLGRLRDENLELAVSGWITLLYVPCKKENAERVKGWLGKNREWFMSNDLLWAAAGKALVEVQEYSEAYNWISDWKTRVEGVDQALLFNFGLAAEHISHWRDGAEARESALLLEPSGALANSLRAVVALNKSLLGESDECSSLLREIEKDSLSEYYSGYFWLASSVLSGQEGEIEDAEQYYREALGLFNRWTERPGIKAAFTDSVAILAGLVPWAKGKPSNITRRWGKYKGFFDNYDVVKIVFVTIAIAYFVFILLSALSDLE